MSVTESEPYDCSLISDDDYSVLPCLEGGPQWWQIGRQVGWSLGVWFIWIVSSPACAKFWKYLCNGKHPFWIQKYVGSMHQPAHDLKVEAVLCFAQVFGSLCSVWIWVIKSYSLRVNVSDQLYALEVLFVLLSLAHTIFERIKFGFSIDHAMSFTVFLDCLTLPPIVMQRSGAWAGGSWLTLAYLRAYHCWSPIKRMIELDLFDAFLSNFMQQCILAVLECCLVVFSLAGTLWIMEALGDIEGFTDQFFHSGMGEISFFQMIYFTFVTISTVGFGDYSPTTVLSRGFIIFAILGGVTFFSYISVHVLELVEIESSGRGHYYPSRKFKGGHILVVGGGVTCGSQTVIEAFMRALCRNDKYYDTPDIVLMGQTACSKEVKEMLKSEWALGYKLQYFIGCPLDSKDLLRVKANKASIVFILSDYLTSDTTTEDRVNALIAAALRRLNPKVQYRLMLCSMDSRELSSNIGLSEFDCFSLESLKAGMLGTSLRCPGFSTLMLNLGLPDLPVPNTPFSTTLVPDSHYGQWLKEYAIGCSYEIYGFLPAPYLVGLTFLSAGVKCASLGDVLLLAAQIDGGIQINPSKHVIEKSTILFAICRHIKAINPFAKNNDARVDTWVHKFRRNRKRGQFAKTHHKKFVCMRSDEQVELMYAASLRSGDHAVATTTTTTTTTTNGSIGNISGQVTPVGNQHVGFFKSARGAGGTGSSFESSGTFRNSKATSADQNPVLDSHTSSSETIEENAENLCGSTIAATTTTSTANSSSAASASVGIGDINGGVDLPLPTRRDSGVGMGIMHGFNGGMQRRSSIGSNGGGVINRRGSFGSVGSDPRDGVSPSGKKLNNLSHKAVGVAKARKETVQTNISKIRMYSTKEDVDNLRHQVKQGGHTVIIMLEDHDEMDQQTTWDQLSAIVGNLIFAKDNTPLVVIHAFSAVKNRCTFMKKFAHQLSQVKLLFCVGNVFDPTTLQGAGCHTCTRILTLAPSAPRLERSEYDGTELVIRSDDKKDENNILLMMLLEEYKDIWAMQNIHIIFDWFSPTAMNLLPIPILKEKVIIRRLSGDIKTSPQSSLSLPPLRFGKGSLNEMNEQNNSPPLSSDFSSNVGGVKFGTIKEKSSKQQKSSSSLSRRLNDSWGASGSMDSESSSVATTPKKLPTGGAGGGGVGGGVGFGFSLSLSSSSQQRRVMPSLEQSPTLEQKSAVASSVLGDGVNGGGRSTSKQQPLPPQIEFTGFPESVVSSSSSNAFPVPLQKRSSMQEYVLSFETNKETEKNDSKKLETNKRKSKQKSKQAEKKIKEDHFSSDSEDSDDNSGDDNSDGETMSVDDLNFAEQFPRANCLFAAGYSIPKSFIAALSSMAYYTPGFLELTEALLNPAEYDQKSIPYLIKIPSRFIGKEYRTVAHELQLEGALPLGLLRPGGIEAGTPYPYVVTLVPTSNLVLGSEDRVYLLGEPLWIQTEAIKLGFVSPYHKALTKKVSSVFQESPNRSPNRPNVNSGNVPGAPSSSKSFTFDHALSKKNLEVNDEEEDEKI